jgi:CRP-like cAMP-binding protein
MSTAKEVLCHSALFEGAEDGIIDQFLSCAETVHFDAGEIPVAEATVAHRIFMVVEGELQVTVELQGTDQETNFLRAGPGSFLGMVGFFGEGLSQPYTATALTPLTCLAWSPDDWTRLCEASPAFGFQLSKRIGRELVSRMSRWVENLLQSVSWGM